MRANHEVLEAITATMQTALIHISREDCCYCTPAERPSPCDCAPCAAKHALKLTGNWRRRCSDMERLKHNPRERKIVDAFLEQIDDKRLSMILREEDAPSMRDWFVALSVVRWMVTNCGTAVLNAAGWTYAQYDEDRKAREVVCEDCKRSFNPMVDGVTLCINCDGKRRDVAKRGETS